jgi:hypothetical protein
MIKILASRILKLKANEREHKIVPNSDGDGDDDDGGDDDGGDDDGDDGDDDDGGDGGDGDGDDDDTSSLGDSLEGISERDTHGFFKLESQLFLKQRNESRLIISS